MSAETYQRHGPPFGVRGQHTAVVGRERKASMRILIFHGYLLRGTGSNIYNASLIAALASLGHEVHILCQDRSAGDLPLIGAVGRWEDGELRVDGDAEARVTAYLPDIGR